jgi:hypothetical protein
MTLAVMAAYLRMKWGQGNFLPGPKKEPNVAPAHASIKEAAGPPPMPKTPPPSWALPPPKTVQLPKEEVRRNVERREMSRIEDDEVPPTTREPSPELEPLPNATPYRVKQWEKHAPTFEDKAKGPADTSLGVPIPADKAQGIKDRLIRVYDGIKKDLSDNLSAKPYIKELYRDMDGDPMLDVFNKAIDAYVINVANANLKDAFLYGLKYMDGFQNIRDNLPGMVKDNAKKHRLEDAMKRTMDHIWIQVKNVLNHHNIGLGNLSLTPEQRASIEGILNKDPQGTWRYGPLKNPTKRKFRQRFLNPSHLNYYKRLDKEPKDPWK